MFSITQHVSDPGGGFLPLKAEFGIAVNPMAEAKPAVYPVANRSQAPALASIVSPLCGYVLL
jgi:hypothetical protein